MNEQKGIIIKSTGSWYTILSDRHAYQARLKGRFKQSDFKLTNPIAVGDEVLFIKEEKNDTYLIIDILPRENYIIRKSTRKTHFGHIIASNIDQAVLIVTVDQPKTSLGFIDRFLVSAESFRIPVLIVINKSDQIKAIDQLVYRDVIKDIYQSIDYEVIEVSSIGDKYNIDELKKKLEGKTNLFAGHSGVGKSTLLNVLIPTANQQTTNISMYSNKGVHTTTFAEMFVLNQSTFIIDTPGIKEFGILGIEDNELSHYYREMRPYLGKCKFNNCKHVNEPNCSIIEAVENDEISVERYENYIKLLFEEDIMR